MTKKKNNFELYYLDILAYTDDDFGWKSGYYYSKSKAKQDAKELYKYLKEKNIECCVSVLVCTLNKKDFSKNFAELLNCIIDGKINKYFNAKFSISVDTDITHFFKYTDEVACCYLHEPETT